MCRSSANLGTTKVWCGMGWTGQPLIAEREDRRWAIFGGYDGHIHFMDALTGERILPDVETGDIIKGTPTIDPDGYPLVYSGSRDNLLRVIAFDRPGPGPGAVDRAQRVGATQPLERRLGLVADHPRRLHGRGQREQPLLGDQAQPLLRRSRDGAGRPEGRVHHPGVGPGGARGERRRARLGGELDRRLRGHRLLRHVGGAHLGLRPQPAAHRWPPDGDVPLLHGRRQRPHARGRRRGDALHRRRVRPRSAPRPRGGPAHQGRSEEHRQPDRVGVLRDHQRRVGHLRHARPSTATP